MNDNTEEEEEEEEKEIARKRFCKMLYYQVQSAEDPENQIENFEVVDLLRGIADKLLHAQNVSEGIELLSVDNDTLKEDMLVDEGDSPEFTEARHLELKEVIEGCLEKLTERQRHILSLRFGLKDNYFSTIEEVGRAFKEARARIREIEARALKKIKHPKRIRQLDGFFNPKIKPKLRQLGL